MVFGIAKMDGQPLCAELSHQNGDKLNMQLSVAGARYFRTMNTNDPPWQFPSSCFPITCYWHVGIRACAPGPVTNFRIRIFTGKDKG
jgi:hypothetical protein